ncbi:two-component system, response regulator YesN [Paenibacillus sp. 1_12]|uniref:response regulator transcription factor n=1 Tax=Paenibacillus sp. 1_12 TaxID=1566278 RepID=UPI0008EB4D7B|nr:response regulator [Paenibacillus sp. 1_12]SFL22045.1 two-component system, response regulator YesN [Paenibacillus sp. 1_12]
MIKAMIADDETLVRKGLITVMPWEKFDIRIVGEASNGLRALELIQSQEVDLLFTDLMMPELNGLELMRKLNITHPHIQVVVLTCYPEFEYVQESLRLGAIDYILKTQLEHEKMDAVLQQIVQRYHARQASSQSVVQRYGDSGWLFMNDQPNVDYSALERKYEADRLISIGEGLWFMIERLSDSEQLIREWLDNAATRGWIAGRVLLHKWETLQELQSQVRCYYERELFYLYEPGIRYYDVLAPLNDSDVLQDWKESDLTALSNQWVSRDWITDDVLFQSMLGQLTTARLPVKQLRRLFYDAIVRWNFAEKCQIAEWLYSIDQLTFMEDWKALLMSTRDTVRSMYKREQYPNEIVSGIWKAIEHMQQQDHLNFTQEQIAKVANMSRGYFSQCFKEITGQGFQEYVSDMRLDRAKELLTTTTIPIYIIAEQSGFKDEKYFSRLFLAKVGKLPSDYRS